MKQVFITTSKNENSFKIFQNGFSITNIDANLATPIGAEICR